MHAGATRILAILVGSAAVVSACAGTPKRPARAADPVRGTPKPNDYKVILYVIDGVRQTEAFGDSHHTHIPHLWNDLRPQGTVITNFRNEGLTLTNPGHASILTGTWQTIANNGSQRPTRPTLFEYYRKAHSIPKKETVLVSGKPKLRACSYSRRSGYGKSHGAAVRVGYWDDRRVYDELLSVLRRDRPRLVLACFPSVDEVGHEGEYADYVSAIETIDSLTYAFWNHLQDDPFYAGQTYLIVTNDHGRHIDGRDAFRCHGDECEGCRRIMFLALGPNIRAGHTVTGVYTQRDICRTVARILGFTAERSEGVVIEDLFVPEAVGDEGGK